MLQITKRPHPDPGPIGVDGGKTAAQFATPSLLPQVTAALSATDRRPRRSLALNCQPTGDEEEPDAEDICDSGSPSDRSVASFATAR